MAKYKALVKFEGYVEKKVFEPGEEFEMTVKRSEEIEKNVQDNFGHLKIEKVMERIDEDKKEDTKTEGNKKDKKDDEEAK
jgi:hypothetical protein